jgi:hypothetical protein
MVLFALVALHEVVRDEINEIPGIIRVGWGAGRC